MVNKKNKYLAAQIAAQGPKSGQQRTARRGQQYDELSPPTKHERKITRACQHQAKLVRKEIRKTNRGNIAALFEATKSSRPEATLVETETGYLFRFCGNVITVQSEDEAVQAAVEASAAPFDPYHRVLFASGACGEVKGSKLNARAEASRMRSAGAAVVCKAAPGDRNDNADDIWEENLFSLNLPPGNSTTQSIEASLRSVAEALSLVATQLAGARDDGGVPQNDNMSTRPKVTIFTDCRAAVARIRNINLTARQLESTPYLGKLITRSEYLRHLGVEAELRCSPRLQPEGSKRAKGASRRAAESNGSCKSADSVDEGLQILIDSLEQE